MVCFEIVDVLAKYQGPKVFAEEFDNVERVVEPWPFFRKSVTSSMSHHGAMYTEVVGYSFTFPPAPVQLDILACPGDSVRRPDPPPRPASSSRHPR